MKKIILLISVAIALLISAFNPMSTSVTANAATNASHNTLYASYEWSSFSLPTTTINGTQTSDKIYWDTADLAVLRMFPSSYSGSNTLHSGCALNWTEVNIYSDVLYAGQDGNFYFHKSFTLTKDGNAYYSKNWSSSERESMLLYSGSLPEGNYTFTYVGVYTETAIAVTTFKYVFNFSIHHTIPSYVLKAGGNIVANNGTYTNQTISYSASSEKLNGIYVKEPGSLSYIFYENNVVTINNTNVNGWYYFYAEDISGNATPTASIYLDTTPPNGTLYADGDSVLNGSTTSLSFNYLATDSGSGIDYLEYKPPSSSSWLTYSLGMVIPQTSTNGQYSFRAIDICGNVSIISIIHLSSHEHQYHSVVVSPTCTESGYTRRTCLECGDFYDTDFVPPTGHVYISNVIKEASCTEEGERYYVCEHCGDNYYEAILAFGHNYIITDIIKEGKTTRRVWACTHCGDSYGEDLGNQYEKVASYIELLFNKYTPYMIWVFLSTSGVWSAFIGIFIIIAQKKEEKEKARKMLTNYLIGLIAIFSILVVCPFLVKGIAALTI